MLPVFLKNYKNSIQGRNHVITVRMIRYRPAFANILKRAVSHFAFYIDNNSQLIYRKAGM